MAISIRNIWMRCPIQMHLTELCINTSAAQALMKSISSHPDFFSNNAPLHHVMRLTLDGVDTALATQFIGLVPAVMHLTIVPRRTRRAVPTTTNIVLPRLVNLSLVTSPHDRFYGGMAAPQLSVLKIDSGSTDMALFRFKSLISHVTTLHLSGRIHLVELTFCNFINTASLSVLRLDLLPSEAGDQPREILALMSQYSTLLANVRDLQTNTVWSRSALEILATLRQPGLTLTIFVACPSEHSPIPGKERIRHLCEKQIVRVVRQFPRWP